MHAIKQQNTSTTMNNEDINNKPQRVYAEKETEMETKPEIIPLHVSCSQRPDWSCGPCSAYGVKKPCELV